MKKKKPKLSPTFEEQYEVGITYKKPDGYWVMREKIDVWVTVKHGVNEKNNHAEAEAKARQMHPGCIVDYVTYC